MVLNIVDLLLGVANLVIENGLIECIKILDSKLCTYVEILYSLYKLFLFLSAMVEIELYLL